MGNIAKAFLGVFFLTLMALGGIGITMATAEASEAEKYHADVITEMECSNYNDTVVASCISQAAAAGYNLTVSPVTYDEMGNVQTAEVVLKYNYDIPLFDLLKPKTIRGFTR